MYGPLWYFVCNLFFERIFFASFRHLHALARGDNGDATMVCWPSNHGIAANDAMKMVSTNLGYT
jgi:hypothetical protein